MNARKRAKRTSAHHSGAVTQQACYGHQDVHHVFDPLEGHSLSEIVECITCANKNCDDFLSSVAALEFDEEWMGL